VIEGTHRDRSGSATLLAEFNPVSRDCLSLSSRRHLCQHDERTFVAAFTMLLPQPSLDGEIRFRDRVRLPAGDTGTVIGFYRDTETALILLDTGVRLTVSLNDLDSAS
jgi:hypothetical protein